MCFGRSAGWYVGAVVGPGISVAIFSVMGDKTHRSVKSDVKGLARDDILNSAFDGLYFGRVLFSASIVIEGMEGG